MPAVRTSFFEWARSMVLRYAETGTKVVKPGIFVELNIPLPDQLG
jgi:hypothetical protein